MVEEEKVVLKKNNLNTKFLPPLFMLIAGLIAFIISLIMQYEIKKMLLVLFLSMLVFAIIGTIVKTIVDNFDMHISYDDIFADEEE